MPAVNITGTATSKGVASAAVKAAALISGSAQSQGVATATVTTQQFISAVAAATSATSAIVAPPPRSVALLVRERPSLRLASTITTPGSHIARWAPDEHLPQNALEGLTFSSTMPGGFEVASGTLERNPARDYPDLAEFSTWTIYGAGGEIAWQGRLETTPRTSGDQIAITPGAVGWQAALSDDETARMIYVDIDMTAWTGPSIARQLNLIPNMDVDGPQVTPDPTSGSPALQTTITAVWDRKHRNEGLYDGHGLALASIYYAWNKTFNIDNTDTNWDWFAQLGDDDSAGAFDLTSNLRAAGPGSGTLTTTTSSRKFAMAFMEYEIAGGVTSGMNYTINWTCLAVYGNHGLTKQGTASATTAQGFFASDVVAHAVSTWAPQLVFSTSGGAQTIQPTSFVVPHLSFTDRTTAAEIIKQASRFDLEDWAVWDGPTFWYGPRGTQGNSWQARVGPSGLQETGPQVDRLWNSVVVQYADVTGATRTVGPTGTNATVTDASLSDADPTNPVTAAGLTRRALLSMGTSTSAAAIKVGQVFLQYQKALSTAGQAAIAGHVQDMAGLLWPAWRIRAGDWITFTDAHDTTPRRVVRASYDDNTKTCTVDLDSPPDAMAALLERMQISIKRLGF